MSGCQALPSTPEEALNRPANLVPVGYRPETATIASTVDAAGGMVIVYRWLTADTDAGACRLAAARNGRTRWDGGLRAR